MLLFTSQSSLAQRGGGNEEPSLNNLATFPISAAFDRRSQVDIPNVGIDGAELPLEKGKVKTVHPDADGRIPAGNCCTPVSRKKEAKPFTKASAQSFIDSYN